jgi:hypothetical protein
MAAMTLCYETKDGGLVELTGTFMKYWRGTGLPDYEGDIEGFQEVFPGVFKEMLKAGVIKRID